MVADVHRTLKYGGIFMYPATGLTLLLNLIHNRFCFAEFLFQEFLHLSKHSPTQPPLSIEPERQAPRLVRVHADGLHHRAGWGTR